MRYLPLHILPCLTNFCQPCFGFNWYLSVSETCLSTLVICPSQITKLSDILPYSTVFSRESSQLKYWVNVVPVIYFFTMKPDSCHEIVYCPKWSYTGSRTSRKLWRISRTISLANFYYYCHIITFLYLSQSSSPSLFKRLFIVA